MQIAADSQTPIELEIPFELKALANSHNYQRWAANAVLPYLGRSILEVGAGIGNMTRWLPRREKLVITETDPTLFRLLIADLATQPNGTADVKVLQADATRGFHPGLTDDVDTVVSFNVLEHIDDDASALRNQLDVLRNSSAERPRRLVVFVPAHSWLYGSLDRIFGHYRRYSHRDLIAKLAAIEPQAKITYRYFNTIGIFGWFLVGRVLKKNELGAGSIKAFELLCPIFSKISDAMNLTLRLPFGQSLIVVAEL